MRVMRGSSRVGIKRYARRRMVHRHPNSLAWSESTYGINLVMHKFEVVFIYRVTPGHLYILLAVSTVAY